MVEAKRPVVVGINGTDETLRAARWAGALAVRLGEPLHLVHAMQRVDEALLTITAPQQADAGAYPRELGQSLLDRTAYAIHADFPTLHVSRTLSHRAPLDALVELSHRAHLVVLACDEVSAGGALLVGSTTIKVARSSACPVIAWRGEAVTPNAHPVVVGVDEDDVSDAALTAAFELASCLGVGITAVYAMSPRRTPARGKLPVPVDWTALENEAWQQLSDVVAPFAECWPDVAVAHVVGLGRASRVILNYAAGAQLVVVGSRGRGEIATALLGSTGLGLLHHSPAPVMICPASHTHDQPEHSSRDDRPAHSTSGISNA
jgi:nucleotide-binding universal stress UspA family protein